MEKLTKIINFVDNISAKIGKFFSWLMIVLVLSICYEIVSRYFFNRPTMWSYDVSYMLSSLILVMGVAWVHSERGHVNVDIFYNKFSPRMRAFLDIVFALILFFPCWILILTYMLPDTVYSWSMSEKASMGTWKPFIFPFKTWTFIGLFLFVLQGLVEFIKSIQSFFLGVKE